VARLAIAPLLAGGPCCVAHHPWCEHATTWWLLTRHTAVEIDPFSAAFTARLPLTAAILLHALLITAYLPILQALAVPIRPSGRRLARAIAWCTLAIVAVDAWWDVLNLISTAGR
jgi:hypothetical protein